MKSFRQHIREFAAPTQSHRETTWYHGTSYWDRAENIFKVGLRPGHEIVTHNGGRMEPVRGKIYMTSDLEMGVIHAIGGYMMGYDLPDSFIEKDGRYGGLVVFDGTGFEDIQPDEDEVGKLISKVYDYHSNIGPELDWLGDMAEEELTPEQLAYVKDGEYEYWAEAGKILIPLMTDEQIYEILRYTNNASVEGKILPQQLWRIDKTRSSELEKDGRNFFDVAELVESR